MYSVIKTLIILICIVGILYLFIINTRYKNDVTGTKEDIIKYFKEQNAVNLKNGIKAKDLPPSIAKNPYRLMMVKDNTLKFEKGKYYLNIK